MIHLLVARHGETDYNAENRYAGSSDVPLNEKGLAQARELALDERINRAELIVSSPKIRAVQTAQAVRDKTSKPVFVVPEFAERCFGVFEGLTAEEIQEKYPELWALKCLKLESESPHGGESLKEFTLRTNKGLDFLRENYDGKTLLLVAHGLVAREIYRIANNLSYVDVEKILLNNGELAEYSL